MQNLPNVSPMELAVVCAAVLLFSIAPAVLAWNEQRRRRRMLLERARLVVESGGALGEAGMQAVSPVALPEREVEAQTPHEPMAASLPTPSDAPIDMVTETPDTMGAPLTTPLWTDAVAAPPAADSPHAAAAGEGSSPAVSGRYSLQLQDLRRVRLRDWPPATVRNDPERSRVWQEAQHAADEHESSIGSTILSSPYPAQSTCLGAAEAEGSKLRLRFLLFPVLWPLAAEQATAEAVFEIDRASGAIHSWVQLRP